MPSGRKSFVVQFRAGRRARRMSLGPSTVLTCDQARTRAITIIAAVKNGEDPAADRAAKRNAATVNDLAERFDTVHITVRLKASTAKEISNASSCPPWGVWLCRKSPARTWRSSTMICGTSPIRQTAASRWFPRCSCWPKCGGCGPTGRTRANTSVNEPSPSRKKFQRHFFRCQCRVVSGWFCETVVSRRHENAMTTGSYSSTLYGPKFRDSENTGPERTLWGHSLP